jgi:hypothetical protein
MKILPAGFLNGGIRPVAPDLCHRDVGKEKDGGGPTCSVHVR